MRINSCRKCGALLSVVGICITCNEALSFSCEKCFGYAEESIHSKCREEQKAISKA